jgi:hypothetical protein
VPRWLRAACPSWFAHPRLADRLAVLRVSRLLGAIADEPISATPWLAQLRTLLQSAP